MFAAPLVKKLRKEAGFSARTFGDAIGVTGRHVRRYEAGEIDPPLSTAGQMARALGIPLDSLYVHTAEADTASTPRGERIAEDNRARPGDSPVTAGTGAAQGSVAT